MKRHLLPIPLLLASATAVASTSPPPQRQPLTLEALAARVEELERALAAREAAGNSTTEENETLKQRVAVLERQVELQQEDSATKAASAPVLSANEKGFSLKSADGAYEVKLRGTVQADNRYFSDDAGAGTSDTFLWRRIRPTIEGSLGSLVGFRLTPEFAGDSATIVDAYVDLKFDPRATLRVGKLKGPIGLERLQSASAIAMIERGFPTELAPNRDIGAQLQGEFAAGRVSYAAGVFNGAPDGRDAPTSDADDNYEFEGRVFFEPWKNSAGALSGLGFGLAGSSGDKEGLGNNFLPRYRTPGQNVFFNYRSTVLADGRHQRLSPQAYFYRNRFGLLGEWISSEQELQLGTNAATHESLRNTAWQLVGSWVLTGEDAGYRGVTKPRHPFKADGEGWGAFELVARVGELEIDEDAFPVYADPSVSAHGARSWGLGLNWYLNANLKLVFNHTWTDFDGGAPLGADRPDEKAFFSRVQVAF
jgi:phosphate-selective porin OprO/OprP